MPSGPEAAAAEDFWVIEPRQHGIWYRARELWHYRYLWWYFAKDTVTSLYRRSKLGWLWLVMRATGPVGLNAILFGGIVDAPSSGYPYLLFMLSGVTTWVLFERSLLYVTRSLERNRRLVTKIYFPRLILPMSAVAPGLIFCGILLLALAVAAVYQHSDDGKWWVTLSPRLLWCVLAIVMALTLTIAVGLWTSVLQARYRDVRYGMRYTMPFGQAFTPIMWGPELLGDKQWLLIFNPFWPIVKLFRAGALGAEMPSAIEMVASVSMIAAVMIAGMWFFNREEAQSVDKM